MKTALRSSCFAVTALAVSACAHPSTPGATAPETIDRAPPTPAAPPRDLEAFGNEWRSAVGTGDTASADRLCTEALEGPSSAEIEADALVCRAVVALQSANVIGAVQRNGAVVPVYDGPQLEVALQHLRRATGLAPAALTPRRELINVLMHTVRAVDSLPAEVKSALEHHHDADHLREVWLPLASELMARGQHETALEVMRAIDERFPRNHQVIANIGAVLMMLDRDGEALPYLEKAVGLRPKDPINVNNLGWWHARNGRPEEADPLFRRAIELAPEGDERRGFGCGYAEFVRDGMKDERRARELAAEHGCE